ncbi:MAG: DUF3833 domain-containing protein [Kiritimatiellia bacterium]
MKKVILLVGVLLVCGGCVGMRIENFGQAQPELILEEFFTGRLTAYGMIKDRRGRITSTFKADFVGSWDENGVGTLDEVFVYDDGSIQNRSWTFTPNGENRYLGKASDIVGSSEMVVNGNTLRMDYTIQVPYKDGSIDLTVRDWLHLHADGVMLNHSYMRKFGFRVAELVVTIIKDFPASQ